MGARTIARLVSADGHSVYLMDAAGGAVSVVDLAAFREAARIAVKLSACANGKAALVDTRTRWQVALLPIVVPVSLSETSARMAAYDPASGRLYLPAARSTVAGGADKPSIVPGSFHSRLVPACDGWVWR